MHLFGPFKTERVKVRTGFAELFKLVNSYMIQVLHKFTIFKNAFIFQLNISNLNFKLKVFSRLKTMKSQQDDLMSDLLKNL